MTSEDGKCDRRTNEEYVEEELQSIVGAVSKGGLEMKKEDITLLRGKLWEQLKEDVELARILVSHKDNHIGTSSYNFQINTGFYTYPGGFDRPCCLEKGDWASLQIKKIRSLDIEAGRVDVQVTAPLCKDTYYVVVREIFTDDENRSTVKVGDEFVITAAYFYSVW